MRLTENVRDNVNSWWDQVAEGWQNLRDKTSRAITRFSHQDEGDARSVVSWGLLPVDIRESDSTITVTLEMPGLDKQDIGVEVHNDHLVVSGEKRIEHQSNQGRYHLHECAYGRFQRAIPLPALVDDQNVDAQYKRGVLHIELHKRSEPGRRRIQIQ